MTKFAAGSDVIVDFEGRDHKGEVLHHSNGWVLAVLAIDPMWDYGSQSSRLNPHSTVCVPEKRVRHTDNKESH